MKKLLSGLLTLGLCGTLCACSQKPVEQPVGNMPNPMTEVSEDEFMNKVGTLVQVPEMAKNVQWYTYTVDGQEQLLGEVQYTLDGKEYCARVMSTSKTSMEDMSDEDITAFTGMYYTWNETKDVEVDYCKGKAMSCDEAKVVVWLDPVPGIVYSISTTDASVSVEDVVNFATSNFVPAQGDN